MKKPSRTASPNPAYSPFLQFGTQADSEFADALEALDVEAYLDLDLELGDVSEVVLNFRALPGCYFTRRRVSEDTVRIRKDEYNALHSKMEEFSRLRKTPSRKRTLEDLDLLKKLLLHRMRGMPQRISNFILEPKYKVLLPGVGAVRVVQVVGRGESKSPFTLLPSAAMARLSHFREWCYNSGRAIWQGTEQDLQWLVSDIDRQIFDAGMQLDLETPIALENLHEYLTSKVFP